VLANVAQTMTRKPPARLLSALQTNSDVLLRLTSDFRFQLPQYQVVSFFEQRPMKMFSSLVYEGDFRRGHTADRLLVDCRETVGPARGRE
jgi:hypothetical protein